MGTFAVKYDQKWYKWLLRTHNAVMEYQFTAMSNFENFHVFNF